MSEFKEVVDGIYRLDVRFEAIYTSVFLVRTSSGFILVDTATTDADVDECIVPALRKMGVAVSELEAVVLTHGHRDHAGGLPRIRALSPSVRVVREVTKLSDGLRTYALPGHTDDSIGVFDSRTGTLISGDGLQGAGVDKYRCNVRNREAYFEILKKIKEDKKIKNIVFSHAYEPWNSDVVFGRSGVEMRIEDCRKCIEAVILRESQR
ncbi:MAG: MBL fold metallo-hydrolase [Clostridia bacterium]|nr:MBL fold metallo-hydrolase [Clostridia bacterium]